MQFPVPQFIDVEDTVIGPLTVKQSVILGIGAMIVFIASQLLTIYAILISVPTILLALAMAFYKPNGRPLYVLFANYFKFVLKPRLYIWRRDPVGTLIKRGIRKETPKDSMSAESKIISRNRLQELAWVLDTQQAIAAEGEEDRGESF